MSGEAFFWFACGWAAAYTLFVCVIMAEGRGMDDDDLDDWDA